MRRRKIVIWVPQAPLQEIVVVASTVIQQVQII